MLVDGRTGNLVVSEHSVSGQSNDIHLLTLSGSTVVFDQAYSLGSPAAQASVDQMDWLGGDIVFCLRANMVAGPMVGQRIGILRPRLGPPGTPGTVVPVPVTAIPPGVINALAVDQSRGLAYFALLVVGGPTKIYSVPVPGDGTAIAPTLVASIPSFALNMAYSNNALSVGSVNLGNDQLQVVDLSVSPPVVSQITNPFSSINGIAVENVSGDLLVTESTGQIHRVDAAQLTPFLGSVGGVPSGAAVRQSMAMYGAATPGLDSYDWVLATNPGGEPSIGNAGFSLTLGSPAGAGIGVVGVSLAESVPLSLFGVSVLVDPASLVLTTLPAGATATVSIPIPNNQALVGFKLYAQAFRLLGGVWSASGGLRVTVLP